jgi:hypothetical protein
VIFFCNLQAQMSGTYIISSPTSSLPTDDYSSLTQFINALYQNQITGNIEVKLRNGVHPGIHHLYSKANNFHLTFESLSGNNTDATITFDGLYETDNVTLKNLTIVAKTNTASLWKDKGAEITYCENIHFYNCIIEGIPGVLHYENGLSFKASKGGSVKKCIFQNLELGVALSPAKHAGSNTYYNPITIDSNYFYFITEAIKIGGQHSSTASVTVSNNLILEPERGIVTYHTNLTGEFSIGRPAYLKIMNNKVYNASDIAIEIGKAQLSNNMYVMNNQASVINKHQIWTLAFKATDVKQLHLEHNSFYGIVHVDDVDSLFCYSNIIYQDTLRGLLARFGSFNNPTYSNIDHNSYYFDYQYSNNWIYVNQNTFNDMLSYQTATGQDKNSVNVSPRFLNRYDLRTCNPLLAGVGAPLPLLNRDIDFETRDTLMPDIGADEFKSHYSPYCVLYDYECDSINPFLISFENYSPFVTGSTWLFGDGSSANGNSVTHQYASQGVYEVSLISTSGNGNDTTSFQIDLSNAMIESISRNVDTLIVNAGYDEYQWYRNDTAIVGAVSNKYVPAKEGVFYCELVKKNSCRQFTNSFVNIGISEFTEISIKVFPNPAHSTFMVQFNNVVDAHWDLVDISGIRLKQGKSYQKKFEEIDISDLEEGVYLLNIQLSNKNYQKKIIKN